MTKTLKKLHLWGICSKLCWFMINKLFSGMKPFELKIKRRLLNGLGHKIGNGTTIVSPIKIQGKLEVGENCWINCNMAVLGNGFVKIGDNCDIAPNVVFLTGGHEIGDSTRRAGKGEVYNITVENGCWIGANSTVGKSITIGEGSVVAACACVLKDVENNSLVGGVPAKFIRRLSDD